jgi:hypothetical protein
LLLLAPSVEHPDADVVLRANWALQATHRSWQACAAAAARSTRAAQQQPHAAKTHLWPQRDLHSVCQLVHAAKNGITALDPEPHFL